MEIIIIAALIAIPVFIWFRGRAENRPFTETMKIGWHKNNPEKLREVGGTEEEIAAAVIVKAKREDNTAKFNASRAESKAKREAKRRANQYNHEYDNKNLVKGDRLVINGAKHNVTGATAELEQGASVGGRMTATRVIGGTLLAGPVGAIIGGVAKKDRNKLYLIVQFPDGTGTSAEFRALDEGKVRPFVDAINNAGLTHLELAA